MREHRPALDPGRETSTEPQAGSGPATVALETQGLAAVAQELTAGDSPGDVSNTRAAFFSRLAACATPDEILEALKSAPSLDVWVAEARAEEQVLLCAMLEQLPQTQASAYDALRTIFFACTDSQLTVMRVCFEKRFGVEIGAIKRDGKRPSWSAGHLRQTWAPFEELPDEHVEENPNVDFLAGKAANGSYWPGNSRTIGVPVDHDADKYTEWYDNTVRHEIGHAVDDTYGITDRFRRSPELGAWSVIDDLCEFIINWYGLNDVGEGIWTSFAEILWEGFTFNEAAPWFRKLDDTKKVKVLKAARFLKTAAANGDDAFSMDDGGGLTLGERTYVFNDYYAEGYSYATSRRDARVSDYQFYAPAEYFAEAYAKYYAPGQAQFGEQLAAKDAMLKTWFDENVAPKPDASPASKGESK